METPGVTVASLASHKKYHIGSLPGSIAGLESVWNNGGPGLGEDLVKLAGVDFLSIEIHVHEPGAIESGVPVERHGVRGVASAGLEPAIRTACGSGDHPRP